ncbi:uncharacterized protein IL334_007621 [Kwoniella shivajii]|uniref:BZIP domain-containing protein n=1 Tax=Kwoniella shivajii TaxID=564305 RepID=A0ABZ1D9N7_9TREE|nr:hypothetical protein IL334_007621 [Kwoniella shivajii]
MSRYSIPSPGKDLPWDDLDPAVKDNGAETFIKQHSPGYMDDSSVSPSTGSSPFSPTSAHDTDGPSSTTTLSTANTLSDTFAVSPTTTLRSDPPEISRSSSCGTAPTSRIEKPSATRSINERSASHVNTNQDGQRYKDLLGIPKRSRTSQQNKDVETLGNRLASRRFRAKFQSAKAVTIESENKLRKSKIWKRLWLRQKRHVEILKLNHVLSKN